MADSDMTPNQPPTRAEAWAALSDIEPQLVPFDDGRLGTLPPPAERFLRRALPEREEVAVSPMVLKMKGEFKLKRWLPFTARQILHPSAGFVWNASVGYWWLRFRGGDAFWHGRGSLDFKIANLASVVNAAGPDIDRSAAGRLATETVAWTPQALLPAAGATWEPVDHARAVVSRPLQGTPSAVTVTVDEDGVLKELTTMRWGDPNGDGFDLHPFGGNVTAVNTFHGFTIATGGTVGWWWGTDRKAEGEFFRYRVLDCYPATGTG